MATPAHDGAPGPQSMQLVMVRGALLPMPQPDSIEEIPSPNVTPETTSLMRMANSLSRQKHGGKFPLAPPPSPSRAGLWVRTVLPC